MIDVYIKNVLEGDSEAFRYIIREYKDRAYSLVMSVVKNEHEAEEVVQKAFIKVFNNLGSFKGNSEFSTWFYRIVINEAYQNVRNAKKAHNFIHEIKNDALSEESNILLKMEKDHQRYYINKLLKELSADHSLALRLFYLEEFNIDEITKITGWTNSNTKVILHRARKKMTEALTTLFGVKKEELY